MSLEPLTFLILLFFIAVVLVVLLVWFILTLGSARPTLSERSDTPKTPVVEIPRPVKTNNQFRGAAVKPKERLQPQTDAFENFVRSTKDELDF